VVQQRAVHAQQLLARVGNSECAGWHREKLNSIRNREENNMVSER
jgi:hypothetical protein